MSSLPITLEMTPEEEQELERMVATSALNRQVGGAHYRDKGIQPIIYIHANNLGFCEGNVVKYITRWREKNGIADLEKAKHYIELLIEMETRK
jgi:hypothetical protein